MKKVFLSLVLLVLFHSISIGQDIYIYNKNGDKVYFHTTHTLNLQNLVAGR
jgi:hypothetical protein